MTCHNQIFFLSIYPEYVHLKATQKLSSNFFKDILMLVTQPNITAGNAPNWCFKTD